MLKKRSCLKLIFLCCLLLGQVGCSSGPASLLPQQDSPTTWEVSGITDPARTSQPHEETSQSETTSTTSRPVTETLPATTTTKTSSEPEATTNKEAPTSQTRTSETKTSTRTEPVPTQKETQAQPTSSVDYSSFEPGQKLNLAVAFPVHTSASEAASKASSQHSYPAGEYYVYKVSPEAINLSRTKAEPGGWTDLGQLAAGSYKIMAEAPAPQETEPAQPTQADTYLDASTKEYNWAWGNPAASGKAVLEANNGLYMKYNAGNSIYLTFDNGYEHDNLTEQILDILAQNQVKASFFVTGHYIKYNPGLVLRMLKEGHLVGNHTQNHKNHARISTAEVIEDLVQWEKSMQKLTGQKPFSNLYRPPSGNFSEKSLRIVRDLGYTTVLWSYGYKDWDPNDQPQVTSSLARLLDHTRPGSVILLHAVSQTNVDLLDAYLKQCLAAGRQFKLLG